MPPVRRWQPPPPRARQWQGIPFWFALGVLALVGWVYSQYKLAPIPGEDAVVGGARVVDGDSLEIGATRIRLFGVDAPEYRQLCKDGAGRDYPCGFAARDALSAIANGQTVSCTPAEGRSYDRIVAICTANGQDLGEAMVRAGRAIELPAHSKGRYTAAERDAREAKRGLWAGSFERPSDWRRAHPR